MRFLAIPGGFVEKDEPLGAAARRELEEETGLRDVYLEIVLNRKQDRRSFRRRILSLGVLKTLGRTRREGRHRPARLYAFRKPGWTYLRERALVT